MGDFLRIFLIFNIFLYLCFSKDSFLTKYEYAKMLYENPRGVGCHLCHGRDAKGLVIARYKQKGKIKELRAPDITKIDFKKFYKKLRSKKVRSVMPSYFLTRSEIKALYFYIKNIKRWFLKKDLWVLFKM